MNPNAACAALTVALWLGAGPAWAGSRPECPAGPATEFGRVHPLDARLTVLVREALATSVTFQRLVRHLAQTDGVVIIAAGSLQSPAGGARLRGAMTHDVTTSGSYRIIRIYVRPSLDLVTIGTLAHELRHATEVLDAPGVRNADAVRALYERIGFHVHAGNFETEAASETGRRVIAEVQACRAQ
jgi:hypothetical protein